MISNFPAKKIYNLGGYVSFTFTPFQYIDSLLPTNMAGRKRVAAIFKSGYSWLNGYATAQTLAFTEEPGVDAQGTLYNLTVAGFVPGDKPDLAAMLEEMASQRFVLVLKDPAGILRMVGAPTRPLDFAASFDSGAGRADQKGYTMKFTGLSGVRAPEYGVPEV